jgi:hypothetical protein
MEILAGLIEILVEQWNKWSKKKGGFGDGKD